MRLPKHVLHLKQLLSKGTNLGELNQLLPSPQFFSTLNLQSSDSSSLQSSHS